MELTIDKGRTMYRRTQQTAQQHHPGSFPWTLSIHPVTKVNYKIDNNRVGQVTDFDKLTLEVWTNGVISAEDAVSPGRKNNYRAPQPLCQPRPKPGATLWFSKRGDAGEEKAIEMTIEELDPVRSFNCLKRAGIRHGRRSDFENRGRYDEGQKSRKRVSRRGHQQIDSLGFTLSKEEV